MIEADKWKIEADNWKKVKVLLDALLPLDEAARRAYLDRARVDGVIREEVESLLALEEEAEKMMPLSAVELARDFLVDDLEESSILGKQIDAYRIVREIGHGGMGAVYLAERADGKFEQKVALKLLRREMNTAALRRRFQHEREILASLEHPHIARLLDAGTSADGTPYLAMEYIEGVAIDEYCAAHQLNLKDRLDLFRQVCAAVAFAHRNLVVHRDLKPSNILVTETGAPKLLDFGISKILTTEAGEPLEQATVTRLGAMTPAYASPEQLQRRSVTTATDIYSLGVILYELLSGHRPFEAVEDDLKKIYEAVLETDPLPPSAMVERKGRELKAITNAETMPHPSTPEGRAGATPPRTSRDPFGGRRTAAPPVGFESQSLRGDLDNIILKALRKEPEKRYSSAENLADDIRRHQQGLPVTARPHTLAYRAEKFFRRHRAGVAASLLVALAVVAGLVATLWQARVAQAERARAEKRFNDVRTLANSFLFEFSPKIENLPGSTPARELLVRRALEYLDNLAQEAGDDRQLQRELGAAYEKVGDVQGYPYNPNLGDVKGALDSYAKSLQIREQLAADAPDANARGELADLLKRIADLHSNGGDYAKAAEFYDRALVIREEIVAAAPADFEARAKLALFVRTRGLIPFYDNDNKKAIEYYTRAREMYAALHRERPDEAKIFEDYAYCFVMIGEAQGWDDDARGAADNLQAGLDMLVPFAARYPLDRSVQRTLMLALQKRAENHQDLKEAEKSVELFAEGARIADASLAADPQSFQARRDVAMANKKLAQALDDAGRSRESVDKMEIALKMFAEMSAADPHNTEYPYDVANTRFSLGETFLTLKDYEAAKNTFERAKTEFEIVQQKNPTSYAGRMSAYNLHRLGRSYAFLHGKNKNSDYARRALENMQAGLERLYALRTAGNLGEYDDKEIAGIEREIENFKKSSD